MKLDHFDRQLLNLVQEDADQTAEQFAQRISLSPSAIARRLKRMSEQGVIVRQTAIIDTKHIGNPNSYIVSIKVESDRSEVLAQLRKWLAIEPHIQQAFYVTGEADYVLVVTAPNIQTYDFLMSRMVSENPNVIRFTTSVALSVVKRGLTIPVPLE